ncbi:MAG: hypothetical protein E7558_01175 [Ruminococcaceae bacterium]|nr:hypothetical protein [Oscillospiraceae bacterium]
MSIHSIGYGVIDIENIELNKNEVALRLKTERGFTSPEIEKCLNSLQSCSCVKYSVVKVPVLCGKNGELDLGFGNFCSTDLTKNLRNCNEAFIFAVTIGTDVDRLLKSLSLVSSADLFITDGLASALVESACDEAEKRIKGELICNPRFSPGYGDLSLSVQPGILQLLNAERLLGIKLNESLMMTPTKTITAIMGIKNEN